MTGVIKVHRSRRILSSMNDVGIQTEYTNSPVRQKHNKIKISRLMCKIIVLNVNIIKEHKCIFDTNLYTIVFI